MINEMLHIGIRNVSNKETPDAEDKFFFHNLQLHRLLYDAEVVYGMLLTFIL